VVVAAVVVVVAVVDGFDSLQRASGGESNVCQDSVHTTIRMPVWKVVIPGTGGGSLRFRSCCHYFSSWSPAASSQPASGVQ
jgi:hypothetical protein